MRTITISDPTRADGAVVECELEFNARGCLLSRTRVGGKSLVAKGPAKFGASKLVGKAMTELGRKGHPARFALSKDAAVTTAMLRDNLAQSFKINMTVDGVTGGVGGAPDEVRDRIQNGGDWSIRGFAASTAGGAFAGSASGLAGPAAGLVSAKASQIGVRSLTNTAAGFGGEVVKSGVSGEEFNPVKTAVNSGISETLSGSVALGPKQSLPGSYYSDAFGSGHPNIPNPRGSWGHALSNYSANNAAADIFISTGTGAGVDVVFGG